jgi:pimeloyl-ACP methyl ester carboxylesterase
VAQARPVNQTSERCFAETGYCISGRIRQFWEQNGGLSVFGLPIGPQHEAVVEGQPLQVQWFERNRLELHPENAPPFDVLLGRLGVDVLEREGRDWWGFERSEPEPGCRYFAETGHNICGSILAAWRAGGLELDGRPGKSEQENLALFGLPLSDARTERLSDGREYTVQWFERVRFELHPQNPPNARVLLGLLGSEMQGRTTAAAPATVTRFEHGPCPFGVPADLRIDCGTLVVPEKRSDPNSGVVQLAVAVARTNSGSPAPDPVLYLSGGPGSPALANTVSFRRGWASYLGNRDLVMIDQRGTGFSQPSLVCRDINDVGDMVIDQNLSGAEKVRAEAEALRRCGDRWMQQGIDLTAYNSAESAADLHDLLGALGYEQWNLFGISYGTRLALTMMRDYPNDVRSAVLDSVYPPQVNLFTALPPTIDRAFDRIFANCAADPQCNAAYPDLENVFYSLVAELNANPVAVQVRHPRSGARVSTNIDGNDLVDILFRTTYRTGELAGLPRFIYDTRNGNYATLSRLESARLGRMFGSQFSQGMYFAVECSEEISFTHLEDMQAAAATYPRLEPFFGGVMEFTKHVYDLCAHYGIGEPEPKENQPVHSDIPTLLLAGEYDPITPPFWAPLAAETLSTSYSYEFPRTGHAVITRGVCPGNMIRAFLNNPTQPPDASCIR